MFINISLRADETPTGSKLLSMVTYWLLAWTPSLFALLNNQLFCISIFHSLNVIAALKIKDFFLPAGC